MLTVPKITPKPLTNSAFGFPRGGERRIAPIALACIHITDNGRTPPATATDERNYANRADSNGPSAHFYVDRTGPAVQAIAWQDFAAWSNGDVRSPDTKVPGIQAVLDLRAKGFNANECYGIEIENCGREPGYPMTTSQVKTNAYLVALAKLEWPELPISTATVHGHRYLNMETRQDCPTGGDLDVLLDQIIAYARDYYEVLLLQAEISDLNAIIDARGEQITKLTALTTAQGAQITDLQAKAESLVETIVGLQERERAWIEYRDAMRTDAGQSLARKAPIEDGPAVPE